MSYNIADLVEHAIDLMPDRVALVDDAREVTYAQLEERTNKLAHYLLEHGVQPGDKVGIYSRNTIEAVEAMVAVFKARAVMINVNYRYVENELQYIFDNSDMVALIHERRYSDKVAAVRARTPKLRTVVVVDDDTTGTVPTAADSVEYETALAQSSADRDFGERSPDDLYMLYTGGTTGMPKGVMWRQEDVWRVLGGGINFLTGEYVADEWDLAKEGQANGALTRYPIPPMIHGGSQWATFQSLFSGGKVVMLPEFSGHGVWRTIDRHGVNVIFITGDAMARPMLDALLEGNPETGKPYELASLFAIASSAALFSPAIKEKFLELLPNRVITDSIGSSETGFGGISMVAKGAEHTGGPRVKIDASTEVLDEQGNPVTPGSGQIGILARKGHIPLGYYKDEAKTAATFKEFNGVRYSIPGDYARVEEDGTVTMLGRGSVSINSGGEKIFPEEVEGALKAHPDIFDALVVGVEDERWGQRVCAVVQCRGDKRPTIEELRPVLTQEIAPYKHPRSLWFVEEIKRSPAGKPDYRWAKEQTTARAADVHAEVSAK
ncbi:acyl-CoA synthetase [Nocardia farcinica]|uniref:Putative acyl-CoA synthetase n=1 Tax=Nocardia farcinica (strain IFM 10152) TaxID=247156 RepID=Q5Z2G7_NOCFA|nr:acyl-CoA synthetase [Nocardia farcinica]MBF6138862.1 acyl-CoA synthetase [Nocardia farcinica]MBF6251855.1 acyl-CoA synthetase [Nocardia farcinica]MBF6257941.1 acyl-CoA synthetase [Nocardia farcinica]MBF6262687.1 acyl-CoA synthetase [Nocardia farcinica]MBF6281191.1 acyl-CoA synthetase [Nocardia farcinica]